MTHFEVEAERRREVLAGYWRTPLEVEALRQPGVSAGSGPEASAVEGRLTHFFGVSGQLLGLRLRTSRPAIPDDPQA